MIGPGKCCQNVCFVNGLLVVSLVFAASDNARFFAAEGARDSATGGSGRKADWLRHWRAENALWRGVHVIQARAGELRLALQPAAGGIGVVGLRDLALNESLLATNTLPLFTLTLRQPQTTREVRLTADAGWNHTRARQGRDGLELQWAQPTNDAIGAVTVRASAALDQRQSAIRWSLRVENASTGWSIWRVAFPQLAIADLGTNGAALFPRGPGEVQRGVWQRAFRYDGSYPGGWCAMQFMAAYREGERPTGLYVGLHDPSGGAKSLELKSDPAAQSARLAIGGTRAIGKCSTRFGAPCRAARCLPPSATANRSSAGSMAI